MVEEQSMIIIDSLVNNMEDSSSAAEEMFEEFSSIEAKSPPFATNLTPHPRKKAPVHIQVGSKEEFNSVIINNLDDIESDKFKGFTGKDLFSPLKLEEMFKLPAMSKEEEKEENSLYIEDLSPTSAHPKDSESLMLIKEQIQNPDKSKIKLFERGYDTQTRERLCSLVTELEDKQGTHKSPYVNINHEPPEKEQNEDDDDALGSMKRLKLSESVDNIQVPPVVKLNYQRTPSNSKEFGKEKKSLSVKKGKSPFKIISELEKSFDYANYNFDYDPVNTIVDAVSIDGNDRDLSLSIRQNSAKKLQKKPVVNFKPIVFDVTDGAVKHIEEEKDDVPQNDEINLSNCNIHSASLLYKIMTTYLTDSSHITKIDLSNNQLVSLKFLYKLRRSLIDTLEELYLSRNKISSLDDVVNYLSPFKNLKTLDLRWNPVNTKFQAVYDEGASDMDIIRYLCYKYCFYVEMNLGLTSFDGEIMDGDLDEEKSRLKRIYEIIKRNVKNQLKRQYDETIAEYK